MKNYLTPLAEHLWQSGIRLAVDWKSGICLSKVPKRNQKVRPNAILMMTRFMEEICELYGMNFMTLTSWTRSVAARFLSLQILSTGYYLPGTIKQKRK